MTNIETLKLALEALKTCDGGKSWADPYQRFDKKMVDKAITALRTAIKTAEKQEPVAWMDEFGNVFPLGAQRGPKYLNEPMKPLYTTPPAAPVQEPVKPYAYEYGRDNGDGTYSVVIDKGSLVQTQPAVYNYARPQNAHKEWPIKELFDHPPAAQRQPLPDEQRRNIVRANKMRHDSDEIDPYGVIDDVEAAHGITGEKT